MEATTNSTNKLHFMFIGAHPDDADIESGGTAIKYLNAGHQVTFVSMTNGDCGHQTESGVALAHRRREESQAVADFLGIEYIVFENHDAELQPTIENRNELIKLVREKKPNIIVTHRSNDYHTDHRNTSILVQDMAYLLAVPNVCPLIPRLTYTPIILFHQDIYSKPYPFEPEILVDISDVFEKKIQSLSLHESQVYEWLPFIENYLDEVPLDKNNRLNWLKTKWDNPGNVLRFLDKMNSLGQRNCKYLEAFEISEYGGRLTQENFKSLIPFGVWNG